MCEGGGDDKAATAVSFRERVGVVDQERLEDHTATSRAPLAGFSVPIVLRLCALCILLVDNLLRLNGHMDDIWVFLAELGV